MQLTSEQRRMMKRAVGNAGKFVAGKSEALKWDGLVELGLAKSTRRSEFGLSVFSLTAEGMEIARRLARGERER